MSKFCKFCGTPIEEGYVCTCPQAAAEQAAAYQQAAPVAAPAAPQYAAPAAPQYAAPAAPQYAAPAAPAAPQYAAPEAPQYAAPAAPQYAAPAQQQYAQQQYAQPAPAAGGVNVDVCKQKAKEALVVAKQVLKAPAEAGQALAARTDKTMSYILIGAQAVSVCLLALLMANAYNSVISSNVYTSALSSKINYFTVFIVAILSSACISFAYAGILYLVIKMFRGNTTFAKCLSLVATRSVIFTIAALVLLIPALVRSYMLIALAVVVAPSLAYAIALGYLFVGLPNVSDLKANRYPYMVPIVEFVSGIVAAIAFYTFIPYCMPSFTGMSSMMSGLF